MWSNNFNNQWAIKFIQKKFNASMNNKKWIQIILKMGIKKKWHNDH